VLDANTEKEPRYFSHLAAAFQQALRTLILFLKFLGRTDQEIYEYSKNLLQKRRQLSDNAENQIFNFFSRNLATPCRRTPTIVAIAHHFSRTDRTPQTNPVETCVN
jgi:hypothetical protein